jgi:hypothetical protein
MKLGTWIMLASIALTNMNCAPEDTPIEVDKQVKVTEQVREQYALETDVAFETDLEGGCSPALQLACLTYCGGTCTNNGQSCACPYRPH